LDGNTMLHLAVKGNNLPVTKVLIEKGLDVNQLNHAGQTCVFVGADNCCSASLMELLLNSGGDVNTVDSRDWTPLVAATYRNASPALIALLLAKGADKTRVISGGKTAMDFAKAKPKVVEQPDLVELMTNPNPLSAQIRPSSLHSTLSFKRTQTQSSISPSKSSETLPSFSGSLDKTVFLSYSFSNSRDRVLNEERLTKLAEALRERGYEVMKDSNHSTTQSNMFRIARNIARSTIFIPCIDREYIHRVFVGSMDAAFLDLCAHEFTEAHSRFGESNMVPVITDSSALDNTYWKGPVGLLLHKVEALQLIEDSQLSSVADGIIERVEKMKKEADNTQ